MQANVGLVVKVSWRDFSVIVQFDFNNHVTIQIFYEKLGKNVFIFFEGSRKSVNPYPWRSSLFRRCPSSRRLCVARSRAFCHAVTSGLWSRQCTCEMRTCIHYSIPPFECVST